MYDAIRIAVGVIWIGAAMFFVIFCILAITLKIIDKNENRKNKNDNKEQNDHVGDLAVRHDFHRANDKEELTADDYMSAYLEDTKESGQTEGSPASADAGNKDMPDDDENNGEDLIKRVSRHFEDFNEKEKIILFCKVRLYPRWQEFNVTYYCLLTNEKIRFRPRSSTPAGVAMKNEIIIFQTEETAIKKTESNNGIQFYNRNEQPQETNNHTSARYWIGLVGGQLGNAIYQKAAKNKKHTFYFDYDSYKTVIAYFENVVDPAADAKPSVDDAPQPSTPEAPAEPVKQSPQANDSGEKEELRKLKEEIEILKKQNDELEEIRRLKEEIGKLKKQNDELRKNIEASEDSSQETY